MRDVLPFPEEFLLAQKCLEGDRASISRLEEICRGDIKNYLLHAGATVGEADELTHELLADCLAERPGYKQRLATYAGTSPLRGWLKAVALNKLLQLRRRQSRDREDNNLDDLDQGGKLPPTSSRQATEAPLLDIMRDAVAAAFRECDPEHFVLVQLAHTNGLLGRELAVLFNCSEATVSRDLEKARRSIAEATMRHVHARDPWLDLKWEDFVELCRVASPAIFGVE